MSLKPRVAEFVLDGTQGATFSCPVEMAYGRSQDSNPVTSSLLQCQANIHQSDFFFPEKDSPLKPKNPGTDIFVEPS
ncbi:uncharacterized protein CLUP02_01394 [Colletotrichum lupini]|uniref:Uncharacterized protein n=1 Tax=Colletotrichum lupini TaxID=145971 RepID=A0A9Q8SC85_9PEZI|nr:uncharacterized protein CLUP02_01394 [Colletotrichum lupini]UQC74742.1 hypothetical protein CLUP02_01394 [Colletotrichum lupini]